LAVSNFSCRGPGLDLSEPGARLIGRCRYVPATASLEINQIRYQGPALVCDAGGKVSELGSRNEIVIAGQLQYDLEKLAYLFRPYLGADAKLTGRDSRSFRFQGALGSTGEPPVVTTWSGQGGMNWQSVEAFGFQIGPGELQV